MEMEKAHGSELFYDGDVADTSWVRGNGPDWPFFIWHVFILLNTDFRLVHCPIFLPTGPLILKSNLMDTQTPPTPQSFP